MKQIFKTIAAFSLVATLSTSCSKDASTTDGTTPVVGAPTLTITVPTADLTLRFNDVATIKFTASPASGAKLKSILITRKNLTSDVTLSVYGDSAATIADSATITRTVNDSVLNSIGNVGDLILYTITITDNKGKSIAKTVNLSIKDIYLTGQFVVGASANNTIQEHFFGFDANAKNTVQLFKGGIAILPVVPSAADSATRARFNVSKVDFSFFFGASLSGLYSPTHPFPAGQGWATEYTFWGANPNSTIFIDPIVTNISQSQFAATNYNVEQTIDAIDFTVSPKTFAYNFQKGTVVAFKTARGAKGLILVVETANSSTSFATFEAKWKK